LGLKAPYLKGFGKNKILSTHNNYILSEICSYLSVGKLQSSAPVFFLAHDAAVAKADGDYK